tara:strand:+ start:273 stop:473 length:201 start_codon:yes stop_codon:yes gene_type:complete
MEREINRLLNDIQEKNGAIYDKLVAIAKKIRKRKKYLLIDVMEMESIVFEDKVQPVSQLDRVEVKI